VAAASGEMQTERAKDYYAVLGVPAEADAETIRKAFRSLARALHPDVNDASDAEERFRDVAEAYQVLSRPGRKRLYDRIGYRGRGNGGFASGSRDPLFEFWRTRRRRAAQTVDVAVGHFEAARGARRTVEIECRESCRDCRGTGAAEGAETRVCANCGGSGRLKRVSASGSGRMLRVDPCPECLGTGRNVSAVCRSCSGVGDVWRRRRIDVSVPAGVEDGTRIRLAQAAGSGDAYVRVKVLPPPRDPAWIRLGALAALFVAVAFFLYLLLR
jgi:molecular chaperone DnaJ